MPDQSALRERPALITIPVDPAPLKVAIVHYWLVAMRGGEKTLEALCELYPEADIFTHVYDASAMSDTIKRHKVFTSFIQRLPLAKSMYKKYLPLMPFAVESFDLQAYDLVLSSEAGPIKGVITRSDALHICYCHSPMRYIWDQYHQYRRNAGWLSRLAMSVFGLPLRMWDTASATRVDHFITNSHYIAGRIRKFYGRNATVINPPVSTAAFAISDEVEDYYLCFGQLVFYKRVDLAVAAFNETGKRLIVVGTGEEEARLRKMAGPNVTFLGRQPDEAIKGLLAKCRALVFPGVEDFGIVPLEAMASGRPVIAYGAGGALETVVDGVTGIIFKAQTAAALNAAIARFEMTETNFVPVEIQQHARGFDKSVFQSKMRAFISRHLTFGVTP
jgi:glycosyltransferase involved in cell wall biosynthesis